MKKGVEEERARKREQAMREARVLMEEGREEMAVKEFSKSIDITP